MARKTIDNVRIQQWGLTLDKWDLAPDTVAINELAVINDSSNKTIALCIGDGIKSPTEYYNDADDNSTNIFFPGIGAGYRLPVAKTNLLGGIKINSAYFSITDDGKFSPTFISYGSGVGENGGPILELPNKHNLTIHGTLTAENVVSEEKYQIQIAGEYVDVTIDFTLSSGDGAGNREIASWKSVLNSASFVSISFTPLLFKKLVNLLWIKTIPSLIGESSSGRCWIARSKSSIIGSKFTNTCSPPYLIKSARSFIVFLL